MQHCCLCAAVEEGLALVKGAPADDEMVITLTELKSELERLIAAGEGGAGEGTEGGAK